MKFLTILVIVFLMVSGCTPAHIAKLPMPSENERSLVVVYRESGFNAGGMPLVFGKNGADLVQLTQKSYTEIYLPPNKYDFFVRSNQADQPYVMPTTLVLGEKKCLRAYPNPSNLAKAVFLSLAYYAGNTFLLEEASCPAPDVLSGYAKKGVQYGQP